jgi:hypothetical protein
MWKPDPSLLVNGQNLWFLMFFRVGTSGLSLRSSSYELDPSLNEQFKQVPKGFVQKSWRTWRILFRDLLALQNHGFTSEPS